MEIACICLYHESSCASLWLGGCRVCIAFTERHWINILIITVLQLVKYTSTSTVLLVGWVGLDMGSLCAQPKGFSAYLAIDYRARQGVWFWHKGANICPGGVTGECEIPGYLVAEVLD